MLSDSVSAGDPEMKAECKPIGAKNSLMLKQGARPLIACTVKHLLLDSVTIWEYKMCETKS